MPKIRKNGLPFVSVALYGMKDMQQKTLTEPYESNEAYL
jgi:hypothetical protein